MNHWKFLVCAILFSTTNYSQTGYFQQEVDYKIRVSLNDSLHQLKGDIEITYSNNSADTLEGIYLHLWPNAYKNNTTAFAKQQLRDQVTDFYFAEEKDRGFIDELAFEVEGVEAQLEIDPKHIDIGFLSFPKALIPGATCTIQTPFRVQIPASFSRLGHVGQSYQITQWYPKPAVYDQNGWHPMPYLDRGEFYSEFGSFEVEITLPENYIVGATGVLQTESEKVFLNGIVSETNQYLQRLGVPASSSFEEFPPSSSTLKTIRYTADQVHDFAWFADKRFKVQRGEVQLKDQKIETWVMFTQFEDFLWENALDYVNRSIQFYSDLVGPYPYPQATAVQSALSAGSGMEYPMITVIGESNSAKSLDQVITHEIGHNWFYGILAFDERENAWMDEGLNTYYEKRYMNRYYEEGELALEPDFLIGDKKMGDLGICLSISPKKWNFSSTDYDL